MSLRPTFPFSAVVGQDDVKLALLLNAIDRKIGGVVLRGEKGSAKSTLARGLSALLPGLVPFVDLPVSATEDRVVGSLDLESALTTGERRFHPGLLAEADRGRLEAVHSGEHAGGIEGPRAELAEAGRVRTGLQDRFEALAGHQVHGEEGRDLGRVAGVLEEDLGDRDAVAPGQGPHQRTLMQHVAVTHRGEPGRCHLQHDDLVGLGDALEADREGEARGAARQRLH